MDAHLLFLLSCICLNWFAFVDLLTNRLMNTGLRIRDACPLQLGRIFTFWDAFCFGLFLSMYAFFLSFYLYDTCAGWHIQTIFFSYFLCEGVCVAIIGYIKCSFDRCSWGSAGATICFWQTFVFRYIIASDFGWLLYVRNWFQAPDQFEPICAHQVHVLNIAACYECARMLWWFYVALKFGFEQVTSVSSCLPCTIASDLVCCMRSCHHVYKCNLRVHLVIFAHFHPKVHFQIQNRGGRGFILYCKSLEMQTKTAISSLYTHAFLTFWSYEFMTFNHLHAAAATRVQIFHTQLAQRRLGILFRMDAIRNC